MTNGSVTMDELFLFHWLGWLLIIIIYFFTNSVRTKYYYLYTMFLILLFIHMKIYIFLQIELTLAFIVLMMSAFVFYVQLRMSFYDVFVTLTVVVSYVALLIWENVSPIWFVVHPMLMIPLIVCTLVIVLNESFVKRIAIVMLGLTIGQLLFNLILTSYGLYELLGGLTFFIMLFSHILLLFIVRTVSILKRIFNINITY